MKKIYLVGAAPIDGTMRFPSEGTIEAPVAIADELIKSGLAIADDLESTKVDDLRTIALRESVSIGPDALKDDLVAAIRKRRQNKA